MTTGDRRPRFRCMAASTGAIPSSPDMPTRPPTVSPAPSFAAATTRSHGRDSVDARLSRGRRSRALLPRTAHGEWAPAGTRPDPIAILEQQGVSRVPELVPIRYGRMAASAFAF